MGNNNSKLSKFICLILRHRPEVINIKLDEFGYANVDELINGVNQRGKSLSYETLQCIVETDKKGRYSFNNDKTKIRANQGHSIEVNLELEEKVPPKVLYHGTSTDNLESIMQDGIKKMNRLYVHLSDNIDTAMKVGSRHGTPVILEIAASVMYHEGFKFYQSLNGVWLTDFVPHFHISELSHTE